VFGFEPTGDQIVLLDFTAITRACGSQLVEGALVLWGEYWMIAPGCKQGINFRGLSGDQALGITYTDQGLFGAWVM